MYDWLTGALHGPSQVITANRRLARVLTEHYAKSQIDAGRVAWQSPSILSWQDWLAELFATAELVTILPTQLNSHQSRVLWERCLRREISNPLLNTAALVRQSRDAWMRVNEYCVPLNQVVAQAQGRDQKIFASAAASYVSILEREQWIDEAQIPAAVVELVRERHAVVADRLTFAGFDRLTPIARQLLDTLREAGSEVIEIQQPAREDNGYVCAYENADSEMRAAGAWARQLLLDGPGQVVGIVAPQLEKDADRTARLIREGMVPGWQVSGEHHPTAVNVSYGRRLSAYPAIAVALHWLRWLREDISSGVLSLLLRSAACGEAELGGRSRLDLELRGLPVMNWSPGRYLKSFERSKVDADASDWFDRVRIVEEYRDSLPSRATPSQWAMQIDQILRKLNWPGDAGLDSVDFQLVNRWRELLNDLARLELVISSMSRDDVLSRLQTLAAETVFQPESDSAIIQLLGPLEAAGMRFDQLWICGLSAANWPPAGRPSPLVSRQVQREYSMPDADPADTLAYANRVLQRLAASADELLFSYAMTDGDAEQSPSGLLENLAAIEPAPGEDPGWYAAQLIECASPVEIGEDPVPTVTREERVLGGASTLQRQITDPFAAFASGRLGIRPVPPMVSGLPANIRGSLIHGALHNLYRDLLSRENIASWAESDLECVLPKALKAAFAALEYRADETLRQILELEKQRESILLRDVVAIDAARNDFTVEGLEVSLELSVEEVKLRLRIDRIDRDENGELIIIDYKTGQPRQFLSSSKEPDDLQLVAYSCAVSDPVAGVAFMNVDSRKVSISGAGREFTPDTDWPDDLARWQAEVVAAALSLQRGDIRINSTLPAKSNRAFGLLSRVRELQHDI
jgi:probable DNA repair protein